ncbi:MAG: hypothetical protein MUC47_04310 [Candidatus Kapabacteria bacterium]|nr:hypothetical protein [Candidatus Kapabacteria bacterium]
MIGIEGLRGPTVVPETSIVQTVAEAAMISSVNKAAMSILFVLVVSHISFRLRM